MIHFNETFIKSRSLLPFLENHVDSLESVCIAMPIMDELAWQLIFDGICSIFSASTCDLWLTDPHPAAADENYLDDDDDSNFLTTEMHPDSRTLEWGHRLMERVFSVLGD